MTKRHHYYFKTPADENLSLLILPQLLPILLCFRIMKNITYLQIVCHILWTNPTYITFISRACMEWTTQLKREMMIIVLNFPVKTRWSLNHRLYEWMCDGNQWVGAKLVLSTLSVLDDTICLAMHQRHIIDKVIKN